MTCRVIPGRKAENLNTAIKMKILLIDNYDSFTYNLRQLLEEEGAEVTVVRNDKYNPSELGGYDKLVLSPGPGIPDEARALKETVRMWAGKKPMLGVCLGHQAIGEVFGGRLINLSKVFHGVQTPVTLTGESDYLFDGLPEKFPAGRYHSWVVDRDSLPEKLVVTSLSDEGQIMSMRHLEYDIHGIQFHPESVLTPEGRTIISNFVKHQ